MTERQDRDVDLVALRVADHLVEADAEIARVDLAAPLDQRVDGADGGSSRRRPTAESWRRDAMPSIGSSRASPEAPMPALVRKKPSSLGAAAMAPATTRPCVPDRRTAARRRSCRCPGRQ